MLRRQYSMLSDDETPRLARRYTDLVLGHPRIVDFGAARQAGLDAATGDWILSLDADEIVTPALAAWIRDFIDSDPPFDVALMPRINVFLERWLRSTPWWPGKPRLFRKDAVIVTTELHHPIGPRPGARIARLPKRQELWLWHFTRLSLADIMAKTNHHTTIEAQHALDAGRGDPRLRELLWRSVREIGVYVGKGGFRDGIGGLAYALDRAYYRFLKQAKRWDIPRAAKRRAEYDQWREKILSDFPSGGKTVFGTADRIPAGGDRPTETPA